PVFAYDQARVAEELAVQGKMLKQLGGFAEGYRQTWLPRLPVDELHAILTRRAMPWLPRLPAEDEYQAAIKVKTERDLWALQGLWSRTQAKLLTAQVIRHANAKHKNVQREWLYHRLCSVWLDHFHAELTYSRPPKGGPPYGPTIAFIRAAFRQI